MNTPTMSATITRAYDQYGARVYDVTVSGVARPGIVPGYNGCEHVTVSVCIDGSTATNYRPNGKGYAPDRSKLFGCARRAALRAWKAEG